MRVKRQEKGRAGEHKQDIEEDHTLHRLQGNPHEAARKDNRQHRREIEGLPCVEWLTAIDLPDEILHLDMEDPTQFVVQDDQVLPHDETEMDQNDREYRFGEELADRHVQGARALPVHDLNGSHDHDETQERIGGSHHEMPASIYDGVGCAYIKGRKPDEVDQWLNRATEPSQDGVQQIENELTNWIHLTLAFAVLKLHVRRHAHITRGQRSRGARTASGLVAGKIW